MERIKFSLSGGLTSAQIKVIHEAVVRTLSETGVACAHRPTIEAVTAQPGVTYEQGRFKFAPETVEAAIESCRAAGKKLQPPEKIFITGPYTCLGIIDMETNAVRSSTAADVVPMLKLAASFNQYGPAPVYPHNLDSRLQVLWLEKACVENTPSMGGFMVSHNPEIIRALRDLYAAAKRRYCLLLQFLISPLRLDEGALDLFWKFKDDPLMDIHPDICPIPVGGMTAPLVISGLLAQSISEALAGWMVVQRLGFGTTNSVLPVRVDSGDMRDMTVGYSLPENVMNQVLARDAAEHFAGYRLHSIYLNTNAKRADSFAAVDRTAQLLLLGLAGFRYFYMGAGQMSMDEIFSPAQFIIDLEIGRFVQHILDGPVWSGNAEEIVKAIAEGAAEGSFITHQTTLDMLPTLFDSLLFRRDTLGHWQSAGQAAVEQLALEKARKAIDSYHFELDSSAQKEVNRVFEQACRSLGVEPPK
jgi:trimethylamine:corrinoid methyltransferase-like protein